MQARIGLEGLADMGFGLAQVALDDIDGGQRIVGRRGFGVEGQAFFEIDDGLVVSLAGEIQPAQKMVELGILESLGQEVEDGLLGLVGPAQRGQAVGHVDDGEGVVRLEAEGLAEGLEGILEAPLLIINVAQGEIGVDQLRIIGDDGQYVADRVIGLAFHAHLAGLVEGIEDADLLPGIEKPLAFQLGGVGERADVAEGGQALFGLLVVGNAPQRSN